MARLRAAEPAAASMASPSGGWCGIDATAANAKIWKSEPEGRSRHSPTTTEHAHATNVVAPTIAHGSIAPPGLSRAPTVAANRTPTMSSPARTCVTIRWRCGSLRP
ncbi:hypothetical protein [Sinomonas flava]|uniref:hypothetical protein n=1 Tax=Sinomonas flava TaxID=496857 RepID=UPI0039A62A16